ncbi:putative mediator of RNA polymerase II transcription subunit 26a [Bidens hawaiensis]|uniref:putative mediator of RNA polymerase II transcription subunit 26a n=1 Tax=Bidens hawaiensis TaxID=980011 RepID=UPI0040499C11
MGSEFIRVKAIVDRIQETQEETRTIAEVSRIKADILDNNVCGYHVSEGVLCGLLLKLKQMAVSMKVLEVSKIGVTVSGLRHHASKDVRDTARNLVRAWRLIVDEWMAANDNNSNNIMPVCPQEQVVPRKIDPPIIEIPTVPTSKQGGGKPPVVVPRKTNNITTDQNPKRAVHKVDLIKRQVNEKRLGMVVLEKEAKINKPLITVMEHGHKINTIEARKMQNPTKSVGPLKTNLDKELSVEDRKLEAAKRKMREGYEEFENRKRQRRVQVIEVHDMMRLGLAPKYEGKNRRFGRNMSRCVGLVR